MWGRIKTFFLGSETIAWARFQAFLGTVAIILTYIDPALLKPVLSPEVFPFVLLANALATEYLRRRRSDLKERHN